jgi:hypothetical protein
MRTVVVRLLGALQIHAECASALLAEHGQLRRRAQLVPVFLRRTLSVALWAIEEFPTARSADGDLGVEDVLAHGAREEVKEGKVHGLRARREHATRVKLLAREHHARCAPKLLLTAARLELPLVKPPSSAVRHGPFLAPKSERKRAQECGSARLLAERPRAPKGSFEKLTPRG